MALTLLCPGRVSPWILPLLVLAVAGDPEAQPLPPLDADPVETMSLAQAQAALDQANPDLASASAAIDDAQAVAHQSLAAIKPVVTASATYLRNNTDATLDLSQAFAGLAQSIAQATMQPVDLGVSGGETIIQPLQSLSANAQVVVPLFAAGAYANIKAAKASARSAAATRDATLAQLHGGLHQTAWLAAAAEALVGVSERAVSNAAAHVQRTQRMRDLGTATQLSVDQAELAWMQRRSDLLTARGALAGMQVSLGVMLGRPAAVKIVLPDAPVNADMNADTTAQDEMVRQALQARPELTAARADEQAARLRLKSARLAYAPTRRFRPTFGAWRRVPVRPRPSPNFASQLRVE